MQQWRLTLDSMVLTDYLCLTPAFPNVPDVFALSVRLLNRLNNGIAMFLGSDFQFGQWYLAPLVGIDSRNEAIRILADLWRNTLLPQLIEYFSGRNEQLLAVLRHPAVPTALSVVQPSPEWEMIGASSSIASGQDPSDENIMQLLVHIAGSDTESGG